MSGRSSTRAIGLPPVAPLACPSPAPVGGSGRAGCAGWAAVEAPADAPSSFAISASSFFRASSSDAPEPGVWVPLAAGGVEVEVEVGGGVAVEVGGGVAVEVGGAVAAG